MDHNYAHCEKEDCDDCYEEMVEHARETITS